MKKTILGENKISVIGAGTMGCGIAQTAAQNGFQVVLYDSDPEKKQAGLVTIKKNLERLASKGELSQESAQASIARVSIIETLEGLQDSFLIIEAIIEDREEKNKLFKQLSAHCDGQTILASNTSSIPITEIASNTSHPENVIGLHFMNPVPLMHGVEIIRGLKTSEDACHKTQKFVRNLLKEPIYSSDRAGFVINRMLMPFINEAITVVGEGTSTIEDVDNGAIHCLNHSMGPLVLSDLIGNDTTHHILSVLEDELGERFKPAPLLTRLVEAGLYGNKCGTGFYLWKQNKPQKVNHDLERYLKME
ncbi:MAG: 3-hydroxybutyryl-CoA dehydrogenase [Nitrospinaceae bacterium]|nr:MAG: 3-hydroxybutyryl-CoA dehydrogenase [Nitrospinaceae bacterium]